MLMYDARVDSRTCDNFDLMWWKPCACVIMENDHRGREYHSMRIEATTGVAVYFGNRRTMRQESLKDSERNEGDGGGQVLRPRAYWAVAGVGVRGGHNLRDGFGSV